MPVQTFLDLSTAHITSKDAALLTKHVTEGRPEDSMMFVYACGDYGWTVSTAGMLDTPFEREMRLAAMRDIGYSDHFVAMMTHAADLGVQMVRLDCDAELEPGLPTFDWENSDEMTVDEPAALQM